MSKPLHSAAPGRGVPARDPRRLQSGFSQIASFLALVEEGDPDRVASRRGLGRSTVGGHLRQVAADYGNDLFRRLEGGLIPTTAGLAAYRVLHPLLAEIGDALKVPRHHDAGRRRLLAHPEGLPGCALARAAEQAAGEAPDFAGRTDILARPAAFFGGFDVSISLDARAGLSSDETVPDRWAAIGPGGSSGWQAADLRWEDLRGRIVALPELPERLSRLVRERLAAAGARPGRSPMDVFEFLSDPARVGAETPLLLVPASLLNRAFVGRHLRCALVEAGADDPVLSVVRSGDSDLSPAALAAFRRRLSALLSGHDRTASPLPGQGELTVRHCLSFCVLHEERNIRRAAERLCIVQPALTVQLHRIEEKLGATLFDRTSRGIRPNDVADRLYAALHPPLMQLLASSRSLARDVRNGSPRKLRIGLMPLVDEESTSAIGLAHALDRCARSVPDRDLEVTEALSARLVRWLRDGKVDLILVDQPLDDPDLVFETIATDRLAVIVDSDSDLLPPGPVSLERLRTLPMVLPSAGNGLRRMLVEHVRRGGWTLQPQIEIDSMATALSLLKTMRYATVLPVGAVHSSRERRRISVHEIHSPHLLRHVCVGRRRREPPCDAALALLEALRDAFSAAVPEDAPSGYAGRPGMRAHPGALPETH